MHEQHAVHLGGQQQRAAHRGSAPPARRRRCPPGCHATRSAAAPRPAPPASRARARRSVPPPRPALGRQHAGAAAVGDDGQPFAAPAARARQGLGGVEQRPPACPTRSMPARRAAASNTSSEPASAPVCEAAAARRPAPAGLDHDHRLVARCGPRRRHELARRLDRFGVQQDGARARLAAQLVEQVAEVDVGAVAQRDEVREADAAPVGPVQHRGGQRARLRDEGQLARQRIAGREAGVQAEARRPAGRCSWARGCAAGAAAPRRAWPGAARRDSGGPSTTAARVPLRPSSAISSGTLAAGVQITASSGAAGRLATSRHARPATRLCLESTAYTGPLKAPARRFRQVVAPTLSGRADAPTTTTELGFSSASRLRVLKVGVGVVVTGTSVRAGSLPGQCQCACHARADTR